MSSLQKKFLFCLECAVTGLFVVSMSVAFVILFRPFYYVQIAPLHLEETSGLSYDEVKEAYDDTLDYCCWLTDTYSAGILPFSTDAAAHFADVRVLFFADFLTVAISCVFSVVLLLLRQTHIYSPLQPLGFGSGFWCGSILIAAEAILALLFAINFSAAFAAFHMIFFAGKDNWVFDPETDPVIDLLPEAFFRNCAIAIAGLIAVMSIALIIQAIRHKKS